MSRKHCRRRAIVPLPPRGLRPKLTPDQVRSLGICHIQNLDAVASGRGTEDLLWQIVELYSVEHFPARSNCGADARLCPFGEKHIGEPKWYERKLAQIAA